MQSVRTTLARHGIRATPIRKAVLHALEAQSGALSQYELEQQLGEQYDRTSIYRALQLFEDKGLVHRVPHLDSVVKYARCFEACAPAQHQDEHLHFLCERCQTTFCLPRTFEPAAGALPQGFRVDDMEVLLRGLCADCAQAEAAPSSSASKAGNSAS
jgi:Fur family ferric uptake transcriptional regulator